MDVRDQRELTISTSEIMDVEVKSNDNASRNGRDVDAPDVIDVTVSENAIHFQETTLYQNVNDINREAKILQDICARLASLPDLFLNPCMLLSALLFLLVLVTYLVGTIWASFYDIYDFEYYNINNQHYHASIIIGTNDSPMDCLDNWRVCQYYDLNCEWQTVEDVSLSKLDLFDAAMIKTQWFISWSTWVRLRIFMLDVNLLSWKYVLLFIIQNAVSWNFRSLGFIVLETHQHVLYSAYYSNAFVSGIITFVLSGFLWVLLVAICLKRQMPRNKRVRHTKLVLRKWGQMTQDGSVDWKSIMANLFVFLFFGYLCFAPTIWLAYDNIVKEIDDEFINSSNTADSDSLIQWIDLLFVQIKAYFLPDFEWYYPFALAGIFQNGLTGVDIITFFLKLIYDLNYKRKQKKEEQYRPLMD